MMSLKGAIVNLMKKMEEKFDELNAESEKRTKRLEKKLDLLVQDRGKEDRPKTYKVLILEVLKDIGGKGMADEIVELVKEKRGDDFRKDSLLPHRTEMIRAGLLKDNPNKKIWQITREGRKFLAEKS